MGQAGVHRVCKIARSSLLSSSPATCQPHERVVLLCLRQRGIYNDVGRPTKHEDNTTECLKLGLRLSRLFVTQSLTVGTSAVLLLDFLVITPDIISYYVEDDPTLLRIFSL
jgi:hypothetical protein